MAARTNRSRLERRLLLSVLAAAVLLAVVAALVTRDEPALPAGEVAADRYTPGRVLVRDGFERDEPEGWGEAESGGPYSGSEVGLSVADGTGRLTLTAPAAVVATTLRSARVRDLQTSFEVVVPELPRRGAGVYVAVHLRANGLYSYRADLRFAPDRKVYSSTARFDGSASALRTLLPPAVVASGVSAGDRISFTFAATGADPVRLTTSTVPPGSATPVEQTVTDGTATQLTAGGVVTVWTYLAKSSEAPRTVALDDLAVTELLPS